jgi:hypothetical protein
MKFRVLATLAVSSLLSVAAFGQASRTWVSGVGDDVNPCSRTAPCKTWAGAISKTAVGGEIDALDPAGFGSVTITKSITLDGTGTMASILNAGTFGININAAASTKVVIRGLSLNGIGTGTNAIQIVGGGAGQVVITDCIIQNSNVGISDTHTTNPLRLIVENTTIVGAVTNGMLLQPTSGGSTNAVVTNSHIIGTGTTTAHDGIVQRAGANLNLNNSEISSSGGVGLHVNGGTAVATVRNSTIQKNGGDGILLDAASTFLIIDFSMLSENAGAGVRKTAGTIFSFGTNRLTDNGVTDTVPTSTFTSY